MSVSASAHCIALPTSFTSWTGGEKPRGAAELGSWDGGFLCRLGAAPQSRSGQGRLGHRETCTFPGETGAWMGPGKLRTVIIKINLSLTPWSMLRKPPGSLAARFAMDLAVLALEHLAQQHLWLRWEVGAGLAFPLWTEEMPFLKYLLPVPDCPVWTNAFRGAQGSPAACPGRSSLTYPGDFAAGTEEGSAQSPEWVFAWRTGCVHSAAAPGQQGPWSKA